MIFFAVESLDVKKNRISLPVSFLVSRPLLRALISSPGASLLSLSNVCASESGASKEPSQALATEALTTISALADLVSETLQDVGALNSRTNTFLPHLRGIHTQKKGVRLSTHRCSFSPTNLRSLLLSSLHDILRAHQRIT